MEKSEHDVVQRESSHVLYMLCVYGANQDDPSPITPWTYRIVMLNKIYD